MSGARSTDGGGGMLYLAGAESYHRQWPDLCQSVFGYHDVLHAYVCGVATCPFIAIASLMG